MYITTYHLDEFKLRTMVKWLNDWVPPVLITGYYKQHSNIILNVNISFKAFNPLTSGVQT